MRIEAGPVVNQLGRLRTPAGVGLRCRRLGSVFDATRSKNAQSAEKLRVNEEAWREH
jgi:hypothetical protein